MVNITINGRKTSVQQGTTILNAAKSVGVEIPHICYWEGLNDIGACRICVVELEGKDKLVSSCNTEVEEGMVIYTNSPRVRQARKINIQLVLAEHDCKCASCPRSGNCALQSIARDLGVVGTSYVENADDYRWDDSFPLIRNAAKCVTCLRCVQVCDKIQNMNVWEKLGSSFRTTVGVTDGVPIRNANCSLCGQCITHCPVGALRECDDRRRFQNAIEDPDKIVLLQIAPAVRTAWGEQIGLSVKDATLGKLVPNEVVHAASIEHARELVVLGNPRKIGDGLVESVKHIVGISIAFAYRLVAELINNRYSRVTAHI